MPRVRRTEICAEDEVQAFHLINRCVRRTFLCGKDRRSKKDYSHRKEWIRARLEELAGIFGIDVLSFDGFDDFLLGFVAPGSIRFLGAKVGGSHQWVDALAGAQRGICTVFQQQFHCSQVGALGLATARWFCNEEG